MFFTSTRVARSAICLALLVGLAACAGGPRAPSYPVPDEPGFYALTGGNNLRRLDGDREWEEETWPERSNMPGNVQFVLNDPMLAGASPATAVQLWKVAWVRSEINANNQAMPITGSTWAVAPIEQFRVPFRYDSPSDRPEVVHIVPTGPLTPGLYAIRIANPNARQARVGIAWNGVDQRQYSAENCVDRYPVEGNVYRGCTANVVGALPAPVYNGQPAVTQPTVNEIGGLGSLAAPAPLPTPVAQAPVTQTMPANATSQGLSIALVDPIRRNDGLLIQGVIINNSSTPQMVPAMQGSLADASGQELRRWVFHPQVTQLAPGARANFKTEVRPVPAGVARADVAFTGTP